MTIVRKTVAGKDVEKNESLFTADVATMEMSVEVLQESENNTTVWTCSLTVWYIPEGF